MTDRAWLVAWLESVLRPAPAGRQGVVCRSLARRRGRRLVGVRRYRRARRGMARHVGDGTGVTSAGRFVLSITRTAWPHPSSIWPTREVARNSRCRSPSRWQPRRTASRSSPPWTVPPRLTANLISAAVRSVPLGQSDGQRALAALKPTYGGRPRRPSPRLARRGRHGDAAARLVLAPPRDPVHTAVPLMNAMLAILLYVGVGALAVSMPCGAWAASGPRPTRGPWRAIRGRRSPAHAAALAMLCRRALLAAVAAWPWSCSARVEPVVWT